MLVRHILNETCESVHDKIRFTVNNITDKSIVINYVTYLTLADINLCVIFALISQTNTPY